MLEDHAAGGAPEGVAVHVQEHLEPGVVEGLDGILELAVAAGDRRQHLGGLQSLFRPTIPLLDLGAFNPERRPAHPGAASADGQFDSARLDGGKNRVHVATQAGEVHCRLRGDLLPLLQEHRRVVRTGRRERVVPCPAQHEDRRTLRRPGGAGFHVVEEFRESPGVQRRRRAEHGIPIGVVAG